MLYICRRVELEGWDIEITFRNWMSKYKAPLAPLLPVSEDAMVVNVGAENTDIEQKNINANEALNNDEPEAKP